MTIDTVVEINSEAFKKHNRICEYAQEKLESLQTLLERIYEHRLYLDEALQQEIKEEIDLLHYFSQHRIDNLTENGGLE